MNKKTIRLIEMEAAAVQQGRLAPARSWKLEKNAAGDYIRTNLDPELARKDRARSWEAKNFVARTRHAVNLSQQAFAEMLGVSVNTLRNWEQNKSEPGGAVKTLLILAGQHPEMVKEAAALARH